MSPECQGCGEHLTQDYVRVFGIQEKVATCPHCSTRDGRHAPGLDDPTEETIL